MTTKNNDWHHRAIIRFTMFNPTADLNGYAKREVEITKELGCDTLVYFVENEGKTMYPSRIAPKDQRVGNRDILLEIINEAKKQEIRVVAAWMGKHCQLATEKEHSDWRMEWLAEDVPDGVPMEEKFLDWQWKGLCLETPYADYLLGQVAEVLTDYPVSGIYFDGIYAQPGTCFCQTCRAKFRQKYGKEMPGRPYDREQRTFAHQSVIDYCRKVRMLLNKTAPQVKFIVDTHGTLDYDAGEPVIFTAPDVDAFLLECYAEIVHEQPYYPGMEVQFIKKETHKPVWCAKWIARIPDWDYSSIPAASIESYIAESFLTGSSPVLIDQSMFWFDQSNFEVIKRNTKWLRESREYIVNAEPVPYVALLHSIEVKIHNKPSPWTYPYYAANERRNFEGFYNALRTNRVPFEVITEDDVRNSDMTRYKTLILPNTVRVSDNTAEAIVRFVAGGGGLVASFLTGTEDEKGNPRQIPVLADLLGIKCDKESISRYFEDDSPVKYYKATLDAHPITNGLGNHTYSFTGKYTCVVPDGNAHSPAYILEKYMAASKAGFGYFNRFPGSNPLTPLVVANSSGGRTVYLAADIDGAFWEFGWPELGRILTQAVLWSGGEPPWKVETDGQLAVQVYMDEKAGKAAVVCVNGVFNQIYTVGFGPHPNDFPKGDRTLNRTHFVNQHYPVYNIRILMKGWADKFNRIRSVSGEKLEIKRKNKDLIVELPKIQAYDLILMDY